MKNKKIWMVILLVIIIAVVAGIMIYNNMDTVKFKKQLDLGHKYLSEMNYEEAVVAFNQAIEIDPRNADAYLGLADAYIGLGDEEAALAALQTGYEATGDERLKARIDEMEAAAVENVPEVSESVEENGETAQRVREISDLIRGDGGVGDVNSNGATHLLTYDQLEAAYRPLAEELEMYLENEQGGWEEDAWHQLSAIYLHLGEMDRCLEARRRGYGITGWEGLMPEAHTDEVLGLVDEYGRIIGDDDDKWTYGEADRYVSLDYVIDGSDSSYQEQYEYDSQGRIAKVISTSDGKITCERTYEYQNDNSVVILDNYETTKYSSVLTYNEYGVHVNETERVEIQ